MISGIILKTGRRVGKKKSIQKKSSDDEYIEDWDIYWSKQKKKDRRWYGLISEFYRKIIFQRVLRSFVKKYFHKNSKLLHAGCGIGEVDIGIINLVSISALDISPEALKLYVKVHGDNAKVIEGSIFNIPAKNESFDGIYNLGVMEHFSQTEIQKILREFNRVLKKNGRMIIFWPPELGLTVIALKIFHFVLNSILKLNIKLHPDEISRLKSRKQAKKIFKKAGFKLIEYYFGPKDLFTYSIVVVQKTT